jgi:uncharacterized glyoxalase superfamily protein PhnB
MLKKYLAIGLQITDFNKALDFYTKVLGFKTKTLDRENEFAEVKFGDLVIALLTKTTLDGMCGSTNFSADSKPGCVIAFEVDSVAAAYKELNAKGVEFIEKPKTTPWGQKVAYFKDIAGYIWELSEAFAE